MKTFKEYGGDTVDPHYHAYGGSLLGPSLGQYRPVADLNARRDDYKKPGFMSKRQMLGPVKHRENQKLEFFRFFRNFRLILYTGMKKKVSPNSLQQVRIASDF